jgi:hypothetical protein
MIVIEPVWMPRCVQGAIAVFGDPQLAIGPETGRIIGIDEQDLATCAWAGRDARAEQRPETGQNAGAPRRTVQEGRVEDGIWNTCRSAFIRIGAEGTHGADRIPQAARRPTQK